MNFARNTTNSRLFLVILFSFLTVAGSGSIALGDFVVAPKSVDDAFDLGRSLGAARQAVNWKSVKQFGHTFNRHGFSSKNTTNLLGRARGTGQAQGQWLNNQQAAEFLSELPDIAGAATVRIPNGLGRVIMPDGSFVNAVWARVVISPSGFRSAFPILP